MSKKPTPSPWTPKIKVEDWGGGHHGIRIVHALDPWGDGLTEWEPGELEQAKLTTTWIATLGALTLGPLLGDIELGKQLHRCPPMPERTKDGMLYKDFACCLSIKTPEMILEAGGGGCYIAIPSAERKDWIARVNESLAAVMAQMGADR